MKKLFIFFAIVCAGFGAFGDDSSDVARAAMRGNIAAATSAGEPVVVSARGARTGNAAAASASASASVATRDISNTRPKAEERKPEQPSVVTTKVSPRAAVQTVSSRTAAPRVSARTAIINNERGNDNNTNGVSRAAAVIHGSAPSPRADGGVQSSRAAIKSYTPAVVRSAVGALSGAARNAPNGKFGNRARAATDAVTGGDNGAIAGAAAVNYKKCREVYYKCMDEFCANKNSQLKRCACSNRIHEFDNTAKQISNFEDAMLDFNGRLLTVNMDAEDAAAITKATEGELAYQQDDKSASKKILDEIAKKLKSSTADSDMNRNMSAISLSLDMDSAFDSIDSFMGADTATKEGAALYNAALPICREMAAEVCDSSDATDIAESGYQMTIEQDCNTVAKAYDTKMAAASEKVREGSALLDMSRLDIYQKRNSDDILTCKKKMLDMMSDSAVCGTGLGKCLDTTGKYIDPSTGAAFLTNSLAELDSVIKRPDSGQKWSTAPGNESFVSFLQSKKKYLEPAMENCQSITDLVWRDFLEDALAQIKLAQGVKLEEMRQGCTVLNAQCLESTLKSITEFDARALSIFGVSADRTVNDMCGKIRGACSALMEKSGGGGDDWQGGMTGIADDKTYDTIISTCREVGKACIIQSCKSISGNWGLCENVDTSINRKSIINREACWDDVQKCVAAAGDDVLTRIFKDRGKTNKGVVDDAFLQDSGEVDNITGLDPHHFYYENYGKMPITTFATGGSAAPATPINGIFNFCDNCDNGSYSCKTCRLAEKIWGNCETNPNNQVSLTDLSEHNDILPSIDTKNPTLLDWFAENTKTKGNRESCRNTECGLGQSKACTSFERNAIISCSVTESSEQTSEGMGYAPGNQINVSNSAPSPYTNLCLGGVKDTFGNCCIDSNNKQGKVLGNNSEGYLGFNEYKAIGAYLTSWNNNERAICTANTAVAVLVAVFDVAGTNPFNGGSKTFYPGRNYLFCVGGDVLGAGVTAGFPSGQTVNCNGIYVVINNTMGTYDGANISNFYRLKSTGTSCADESRCEWKGGNLFSGKYYNGNMPGNDFSSGCNIITSLDANNTDLIIQYR